MTDIRPKLSPKNPYWIERHRYYELKHFCLQYKTWKAYILEIDGMKSKNFPDGTFGQNISNPTLRAVELREEYAAKILMVEHAAHEASPELWNYILKAVTEELTYENLRMVHGLPCGREMWYELYRRFFYILNCSRK